jgi:hypothetical protein
MIIRCNLKQLLVTAWLRGPGTNTNKYMKRLLHNFHRRRQENNCMQQFSPDWQLIPLTPDLPILPPLHPASILRVLPFSQF